jgi:MSHA pilin protein MshC
MTKLNGNSHGFTMIELVIVITIIGILMVVAAPKFFATSDYTSRGFYEELMGAARYAQKFAVASGCQVQLNITANSYSLMQRTACDTSSPFLDVPHPSKAGNFVPDSPSPVAISPAPTSIVFDALGRASATVTISVGTRSFTIHGQTGFVERL